MRRRSFIAGAAISAAAPRLWSQSPAPLLEPHFPTRLHQFIWRNWELANLDVMAAVVKGESSKLRAIGTSMGLPPKPQLTKDQLRRIYITVIRQNWHLLPNDQLIQLLGWTREKFEFTLKEDDFLDVKLGPKPHCDPVIFAEPSSLDRQRAAQMRRTVQATFRENLATDGERAFEFVARLSSSQHESKRDLKARPGQSHLDLSVCNVKAGEGADSRIAERVSDYLRTAMGARLDPSGRSIELEVTPDRPNRFAVDVSESAVQLSGSSAETLMRAVNWMQDEMESLGGPWLPRGQTEKKVSWDPRYLYSYFALYGDPLLEPEIDPFPDGYLEKLARTGINGVWMQCVLNNMAPSKAFPEFGRRADERLRNLTRLIERAKRFGMRIFLYVNEPRAMPAEFFRNRPEIKGAGNRGLFAMCTTPRVVRDWMSDSLAYLVERVPELGGVFTITMSENFTHCFSKFHPETCPRCSKRNSWDVVGEVVEAVRSGVRRSSKTAEVINWDWGWPAELSRNLIPKLAPDTRYMSVSEWSMPIERGGVKTEIGEYSISVVGPGPRATANWELARRAGVRTMAKTHFNNTWEISAIPYIPVPHLIARHCTNLTRAGITGIQASWTLGGYPSPNLEVAKEFYSSPAESADSVLLRVAERRYGKSAAPQIVASWASFSKAFELYPYSVAIYTIPTQHGPANLLRSKPTGVRNSMILFPQDDYKSWSGKYPPEVVQREFTRMADQWEQALDPFRKAIDVVPAIKKRQALEDLAIAETCFIHFRSTANQIAFYIARDAVRTPETLARMRELVKQEMELARRMYPIAKRHSVIGYEASNHYYYRPTDLAEKILNCQYLLDHELKANRNG
jgi:hypothetical protein